MSQARFIALVAIGIFFCMVGLSPTHVPAQTDPPKKIQPEKTPPVKTKESKKDVAPTSKQLARAEAIGKGHSYDKHVVQGKEFPEVKSKDDFIQMISNILANPSHTKKLANNREAFYDRPSNTLVLVNPNARDKGTCFRPSAGKRYYDNLK